MSLFKKEITESEAAAYVVGAILKEAQDVWPRLYSALQNIDKDKFVVEDETMASFDLALAIIAQEQQAVYNLFPKDQAERIDKWVLHCIDTKDWGEYALGEVNAYGEKVRNALQNVNSGGDPLSAIPARLLHRWVGKSIHKFDLEVDGTKTGIINPFHLTMLAAQFHALTGKWKAIQERYDLIESDIPLDDNQPSPTV